MGLMKTVKLRRNRGIKLPKKKISPEVEEPSPSIHQPRLIFCIAAYEAAGTIGRTIESVKPYADEVVVVEGRFKYVPGYSKAEHPREAPTRSTDSTAELARSLGATVIQPPEPLLQPKQRDLYLRGRPGDVYWVIDADMILEGIVNKEEMLNGPDNVWGVWRYERAEDYRTSGVLQFWPWIRRHVGEQVMHSIGQLQIDGFGRLMDATYPGYRAVPINEFWLRHI